MGQEQLNDNENPNKENGILWLEIIQVLAVVALNFIVIAFGNH